MEEHHSKPAVQLALIALAHVFNFFGHVLDIDFIEAPGAEQTRGLASLDSEILIIKARRSGFQRFGAHGTFH